MSNVVVQDIRLLSCFNSQPLDTSVAFALLWLVFSDDALKLNDRPVLKKHLSTLSLGKTSISEIWKVIALGNIDSFVQASEILNNDLEEEGRNFFLVMAIEICAESGRLDDAANHVLRFYADLLGFSLAQLKTMHSETNGTPFPEPADLSSPEWWAAIDIKSDVENMEAVDLTRNQAFVILGLESNADAAEIKMAYRRQVQTLHPDRFDGAGLAAKESAQSRFILARKAYEVLK